MPEEPSSEAFCLDPQLGAGLLSLCVRQSLPFRGARKSLQSGSMQPVLTAPQSGVGLRHRRQPHSPLFLLSLLTKVPRATGMTTLEPPLFLEQAMGPISPSQQVWHFLSLCVITRGSVLSFSLPRALEAPATDQLG